MASRKSTHAKLYSFTYSSNLPSNLCPYFWKLLAAVLLFIPNALMQVPSRIFMAIKKSEGYDCSDHRFLGTVLWVLIGVASFILYAECHLVKAIFNCYSYKSHPANGALVVDAFIIGACIFIPLRAKVLKKNEEATEPPAPKEPSIIAEFFKAKYNRYCPKIDWTD